MERHPVTNVSFRANATAQFDLDQVFTMEYNTSNLKLVLQHILDNLATVQTQAADAVDKSTR
jgi:hypothetical protein